MNRRNRHPRYPHYYVVCVFDRCDTLLTSRLTVPRNRRRKRYSEHLKTGNHAKVDDRERSLMADIMLAGEVRWR